MNISISPDKENIFYTYKENGGIVGIVADITGGNKKNVFEYPFLEWLPQWGKSGIYLSTKPSYDTLGYLYKLNTRNGSIQRILGDINGLTALTSNSGEKILYSESNSDGVVSYIYNTATQEKTNTILDTMPEKCVWGKEDIKIYCPTPIYFGWEGVRCQGICPYPSSGCSL